MPDRATSSPCPDEEALAALLEGTLAGAEREVVEEHVRRCSLCQIDLAEQRRVREALRRLAPELAAPAALRQRVRAAIRPRRATWRRPARLAGALVAVFAVLALIAFARVGTGRQHAVPATMLARLHRAETLGQAPTAFASSDPAAIAAWIQRQTGRTLKVPDYSGAGYLPEGVRREPALGNDAVTVVYRDGGERLSCTMLAGAPALRGFAPLAPGTSIDIARVDEVSLAAYRADGTTYLLATTAPPSELQALLAPATAPY